MTNIKILQCEDAHRWQEFVEYHSSGTIYHTLLWQSIVTTTYGHRPVYLLLKNNSERIIGGIPIFIINSKVTSSRLSSLPCAQFCNPLVNNQMEYDELMGYLINLARIRNLAYIEIKTGNNFNLNTRKYGRVFLNYSTFKLNLNKPIDEIRKSFHRNCIQRAINKAYRNNLELVVGNSEDDVRSFYRLYLQMRRSNGLLPQPIKFFLTMWRNLAKHHFIDILLCRYNGRIVSSILLLKYKDTVTYEYGASRREMLKHKVSHFLLWEAIKRSKLQGYKFFDFGRTSKNNTGLSEFKRRWGTQREILPYYFIPEMHGTAKLRQKNTAKKIMYYIIKNLPGSACQILGRALYRHFI